MLLRNLVGRCHLPTKSALGGGGGVPANYQPCLLRRRWRRRRFSCYLDAVDYHDDGRGGDGDGRSAATGKNSFEVEVRSSPVQVPVHLIQSSSSTSSPQSNDTTLRSKILRNTCISRHHLTPEIPLRLITAECEIYHRPVTADSEDNGHGFDNDPFWGFYWPGGQALTRFILDNRNLFKGRRILDVGCGCGASSIAAILSAASHVTANDIDQAALAATRINAELNQIDVAATVGLELDHRNRIGLLPLSDDVNDPACYDVILIGDLFYDTEIADLLLPWLAAMKKTARKTEIYVGDPGRHGLTEREGMLGRSMTQLARYELPENVCIENNGFSHATVWRFEGGDGGSGW